MFKPMLAPNEKVDLDTIAYPILASYKLDGIRCLFIKGEMLSRSLKPIQNKQLREKFQPLVDFSREHDCILDGEIYSPELSFQEITRYVMTKDFTDPKSIKKHGEVLTIPEHLKYYAFDTIGTDFNVGFHKRLFALALDMQDFSDLVKVVAHKQMDSKEDVEKYFETALKEDYEGLILRDSSGKYKTGRGTIKEGLIYKVKPFVTFDAKIIGVVQATEVDPNAEVTTNELGRSVTSKKKDDRILIEKASAFIVEYEGLEVKPTLAMTDGEKEEVWANREAYIGKMIEYKGMLVGAKSVPRHPVMIRFREDK